LQAIGARQGNHDESPREWREDTESTPGSEKENANEPGNGFEELLRSQNGTNKALARLTEVLSRQGGSDSARGVGRMRWRKCGNIINIEATFEAVSRQRWPYYGDGKISSEKFVKLFNLAIANRSIPSIEQTRFFIRLARISDPTWGGALPSEVEPLAHVQKVFLDQYWNSDLQDLALRKFEEAKLTYKEGDPTHFIQQLDTWHTRLSALTHVKLSINYIIKRLIDKFPASRRDLLRVGMVGRGHNFSDFKSQVISVIHPKDFKDKGSRGNKPASNPGQQKEGRGNYFGNKNAEGGEQQARRLSFKHPDGFGNDRFQNGNRAVHNFPTNKVDNRESPHPKKLYDLRGEGSQGIHSRQGGDKQQEAIPDLEN